MKAPIVGRCAFRSSAVVSLLLLLFPLAARAQQPVGSEFQVNTFTTGTQSAGRVARHPDGSFIVVWDSVGQDGSLSGTFGQIYDGNGATVGGEFRVNSYITGGQFAPAVAAAANGEFVVVWASGLQDGSDNGIFGQRIGAAGALLGGEFLVNSYTSGRQTNPRVAASPGGNFVVVWDSVGQDGSLDGIFGQCFAAAGTRVGSEFRVNSYTNQYQYLPDVAMSANGSFAVVWMDDPRRNTYGQRYSADCTPSGGEFQAHSGLTPNIAMDAAGNFVVAGMLAAPGDDGYGIWAQRFNSAGAAQGSEFRVNTYTTGWQVWPAVAMEAGGDFVVTWGTDIMFVSEEVSARAYRANGTPAGPEFRVNTYTTGPQSRPAVGMGDNGDFVIAWTSASDGNGTGVNAQRFLLPDLIFADGFNAGP